MILKENNYWHINNETGYNYCGRNRKNIKRK